MAIKVIVELQAKPGRRDELKHVLESLIATQGPGQDGFLGSTRYGVLAGPDVLVEIADWESAEARDAHMKGSRSNGCIRTAARVAGRPIQGHGHQPAPLNLTRRRGQALDQRPGLRQPTRIRYVQFLLREDQVPRVVITHAVEDVDRWLKGKAERAAALPGATDVTDLVAMDGSNHAAVAFGIDDLDSLKAMLSSVPPEMAAQAESHGVIMPMTVYVEP
jgi:quinol monooxygenase YgiN